MSSLWFDGMVVDGFYLFLILRILRCDCIFQIINAGITSGAKGALDLWRRQSFSSGESVSEQKEKEDAFDRRTSFDDDNVV